MVSNKEIRSKISSIITSLGYKNAVESTIYNLFIEDKRNHLNRLVADALDAVALAGAV